MPVVINEFEVVSDQPALPPSQPVTQEAPGQPQRSATPYDVESILRREKERLARVQAH